MKPIVRLNLSGVANILGTVKLFLSGGGPHQYHVFGPKCVLTPPSLCIVAWLCMYICVVCAVRAPAIDEKFYGI